MAAAAADERMGEEQLCAHVVVIVEEAKTLSCDLFTAAEHRLTREEGEGEERMSMREYI